RFVQIGERPAGTGASRTGGDAATGERRWRVAKSSRERENARRLGGSATRQFTRASPDIRAVRPQCKDARGERRTCRVRGQVARRREWRTGMASDRRQISDRRLPAFARGSGQGRRRWGRDRGEEPGNTVEKKRERHLREIY